MRSVALNNSVNLAYFSAKFSANERAPCLTYRLTAVLCENIENHEVVKINDCLSN